MLYTDLLSKWDRYVILVNGETKQNEDTPRQKVTKLLLTFFTALTHQRNIVWVHIMKMSISTKCRFCGYVDFSLVLACSSWTPNTSIFKYQDLGEKIHVNRINNFLKKHNLRFSDPILIFLGHSFCSNWDSQMLSLFLIMLRVCEAELISL